MARRTDMAIWLAGGDVKQRAADPVPQIKSTSVMNNVHETVSKDQTDGTEKHRKALRTAFNPAHKSAVDTQSSVEYLPGSSFGVTPTASSPGSPTGSLTGLHTGPPTRLPTEPLTGPPTGPPAGLHARRRRVPKVEEVDDDDEEGEEVEEQEYGKKRGPSPSQSVAGIKTKPSHERPVSHLTCLGEVLERTEPPSQSNVKLRKSRSG